MLEVERLTLAYGRKSVVRDVSFAVREGEIVALAGHNGAGKTTILRAAMGLMRPQGGRVCFAGEPIAAGATAALVRRGLSFVPQGDNTFRHLTVADNLAIASRGLARGARVSEADVFRLFPVLAERRRTLASTLSGGQRQMLAIGQALLRGPRLVMLDEPSTGLAPVLVEGVFAAIRALRSEFGLSILVVDQNVHRLMELADRLEVLKAGELVFSGAPAELDARTELWGLF